MKLGISSKDLQHLILTTVRLDLMRNMSSSEGVGR
jgi:hypothetical protein